VCRRDKKGLFCVHLVCQKRQGQIAWRKHEKQQMGQRLIAWHRRVKWVCGHGMAQEGEGIT
jgi:hypothetical protein